MQVSAAFTLHKKDDLDRLKASIHAVSISFVERVLTGFAAFDYRRITAIVANLIPSSPTVDG